MWFRTVLFIFAFALLGGAAVYAEEPPVPKSKQKEIGNLHEKLEESEKKKKSLEEEAKHIKGDLGSTKQKLIEVGKSIQKNEKTLKDLENRIAELEDKRQSLETMLEQDRKSIAGLILALERIRRVPPEAMIAKPDAPYKTAQSASLMGNIIPTLYSKADALRENLKSLENVTADLEKKRETALAASQALEVEKKTLAGLVSNRERLFADAHQDLAAQEADVRRISRQAKNLQDLVSRLNESREKERAEEDRRQQLASASSSASPPPARRGNVYIPKPGQSRLPVAGIIRVGFDDPDAFGGHSKGLTIESREGGLVVAPMGGVVRFAGPFRNYGNMVIVEHRNGYHSLIAGLEKIDTVVGQSVSTGEALGFLDRSANPSLYYELRLNGKPVNPARKFSGLS